MEIKPQNRIYHSGLNITCLFLSRRDPNIPTEGKYPSLMLRYLNPCSCLSQTQQLEALCKGILFKKINTSYLYKSLTLHFQVPSLVLQSRVCGIFLGSRYKLTWCSRTCPVDRGGQGNLSAPAPVEETELSRGTEDPIWLFSAVPGAPKGFDPMVCVYTHITARKVPLTGQLPD